MSPEPTLLTNSTLICGDEDGRVLEDHALLLRDGQIAAMGPSQNMRETHPNADTIDLHGQLILPGGICAHTHFYGAYARGMAIPGPAPVNFPQILRRLWWPLDRSLSADAVRLSALVSALDAIRHGTTTLFDHHASPACVEYSLDHIAAALEAAGLRGVLCYEVSDRDGPETAEAGIAENIRFLREAKQKPLLSAMFGLHASMTLSEETLRRCVAAESNAGFHIHVAEHEADQEDSLERYGCRVVERLHRAAVLRPNSIIAHAVHTTEEEHEILARNRTWVSHQPRSNMNNAVGAMAWDSMLERGIRLCLGNDGFSNNMWAEWKAAYLLQKVVTRDARKADGADIATVAMRHNAALTQPHFPDRPIGCLAVGAAADLIVVDYQPFTPLTAGNFPWHVLFGFESSLVTHTMVAGKWLMRDRQVLTLDEKEIQREALALAPAIWQEYEKRAREELDH
ncbi:MAG: putative aminohydrolase SsnA [Anaerolineaceae bacterium]|nr:putative aminohydrolase SsnA [Anaerolineaceae bacterium]